MNMIKLLSASAVLLSAVSVMPVMAGGAGKDCDVTHHMGHWGETGFRHAGRVLDLSDDQKATLKTQHEATKAEREQRHSERVKARAALEAAAKSGANDAELAVLAEALGKLQAEQELAAIKARQAFLAVLTDEQKAKLAKRSAKRFGHRMERSQPKPS